MKKIKLGKGYIAGVAALLAIVGTTCLTGAYAAIGIDHSKEGSLTLTTDGTFTEDLATIDTGLDVRIYQIATVDDTGTTYTPLEAYTTDLTTPLQNVSADTTADDWNAMTATAQGIIEAGAIDPTEEQTMTSTSTSIDFTGLDLGIYLVMADSVNSAQYAYDFTPFMIAVPNNYYNSGAADANDDWIYEVTASLKMGRQQRYGRLIIEKTLDNINASLGDITFVFNVDGTDLTSYATVTEGDAVVDMTGVGTTLQYENSSHITFSTAGTDRVVLSHIPAGMTVTVTEEDAASYDEVKGGAQSVVIVGDEYDAEGNLIENQENVAKVTYENDYNGNTIQQNSVVNHFENQDGKWVLNPAPEYDNGGGEVVQ